MGQQLSFSLLLGGPFGMKVLKKNKSEQTQLGLWPVGAGRTQIHEGQFGLKGTLGAHRLLV